MQAASGVDPLAAFDLTSEGIGSGGNNRECTMFLREGRTVISTS
jgi:hypothetical protein